MCLDLDDFDQAPNDLPARLEVRLVEAVADLTGKVLELAKYQPQFFALGAEIRGHGDLLLQAFQTLASAGQSRLEFGLLQQAVFEGVDQPTDAALDRFDLLVELIHVDVRLLLAAEATFEFLLKCPRVLEHRADIGPHGGVQSVQADGLVRTDLCSAEAIRIHPTAAVIRIRGLVVLDEAADPLAVPAIIAAPAHDQSLQQVTRILHMLAMALAILGDLLGDGSEQFRADDRRHGDHELIVGRSGIARSVAARMLGLATPGPQSGAALAHARLPEDRLPLVSRVGQQLAHRENMPGFPLGAGNASFAEPTTDLVHGQSVSPHPFE